MLRYFFENDLVSYSEKEITSWQEGVKESCQSLLKKGIIKAGYVDEIIACVAEHGPYIVIVPQVAMPHSSDTSHNVVDTAIAFTKMKQSIVFDSPVDDVKEATLFFTLAAKNPEAHMANIQHLSELLMTEGLIEDLVATSSLADYQRVMEQYDI